MLKAIRAVMVALAMVLISSCATTKSPLVIAEETLASSLDVTTTLVATDYEQAAPCRAQNVPVSAACSQLEKVVPGAHKTANDIRTVYPPILTAGNATTDTYRQALAFQAALASSSTATADQKAAANAAVTDALGKMNAAIANVAIYVANAQAIINGWLKGAGK